MTVKDDPAEFHTGMPNWEERCQYLWRVDVAPADTSFIQESFQYHQNLKNLKQKVGKDSGLILLWIITQPFCTLNSCSTCHCAMGPGWPSTPLAMDCFGSLPHCNALTREAPLWREEKAQRASNHYHREIRNFLSFWELFVISAHEGRTLKWKCKWRWHRMTLLHTQQWQSYSSLLSVLWQAAQLANSVAHLVFSTSSAIRSCIQFGAAGAFHWAPEGLAKVLKKEENYSSLRQNSYGHDFQKPPRVLYSHLKSLVRVVFPEESGFFTR